MSKCKAIFIFLFAVFFCHLVASAQKLTANAPQQVAVGQQFRLTYTVNSQDVSGFRIGQIPDAFEILMGPSTSSQSSFSIVNGHTSQTSSITYTYILSATKNGSFTIPAASISVDGKTVNSNTLTIKVSGTEQSNGANGSRGGNSQQTETRQAGSHISGSDLFIKVSANKRKVVEQEPILLTYKVYTLVSLTELEGKMPDLKGFHTQEIPLPQEKSFKVEQFNGRNYKTVTWSQYVMFPQMTGKLQIPPITFNGVVMQVNRNIDPFEAFFNGGSGYVEVKKQIQAPGVDIEVEPLPQRPAGFSGGVGRLSMTAEIDKSELKSNDPLTVKVTISGVGNLQLIKEPAVKFPLDFDTYDAKRKDNTRLTANGLEGNVTFEYLAVPRHPGQFDIPAIEFVYFDTQDKAYKTLKSEPFHLYVAKGEGSENVMQHFGQEDVETLAKDIHHIKLGDTRQHRHDDLFFGSSNYWIVFGTLLIVFVSLFLVFRRRAIENADVVKSRGKKANKVATKRMRQAAKLMKENKPGQFYDEALRALWGYVGDKMNIPVEQLSRENISGRLQERNVASATIDNFIGAIDECEFERFAPGDPKGNMNKVYEKAMTAIEQIEDDMKRKHRKNFASAMALLLLVLTPLSVSAVTKAEADSAYMNEDFHKAVADYEALIQEGVSPELYYNLGNAYYRLDDITHAVLSYERALQLSPGDADIRFNLQMAQSKTVDKIVPESEMFFVTWYHSLVNLADVDRWAYLALGSLAMAIVLALLYLFAGQVWLRKIGFFGGIIAVVGFLLFNVFAWQQKTFMQSRSGAIIIQSAVPVKSTPAQGGTDLFILHEGTKVSITDDSMDDWKEIRVADGKEGWIQANQIEII